MDKSNEIIFDDSEVEADQEDYFEQTVFLLRDNDHEFSVGLITMLECVGIAIENGELPKFPKSWFDEIDGVYGTSFSSNEKLYYIE